MYLLHKVGWKQLHFCHLVLYFLFKSQPVGEKRAKKVVSDSGHKEHW